MLYFFDDCHAQNFILLVANNCRERHTDYWAAYYVLTCKHNIRGKTLQHIGRFIDWVGILNEDFSEDYQLIVQLAFMIFSNSDEELTKLVHYSHTEYRDIIIQAIEVRKNGMHPVPVR